MGDAPHTLWLRPADAPPPFTHSSCQGCLSSEQGLHCRAHVAGQACAHPLLAGQHERLARVLAELNREVVDPEHGRGIVELQWVRSLRVDNDEAELVLSFAPEPGLGQELSESAFQTLRRLLPDTDIYVRHQA